MILVYILLLAILGLELYLIRLLRRTNAEVDRVKSIALSGRARQSTITNMQQNPAVTPRVEKARQMGPRHDEVRGARQVRALRFERKGGEYLDRDSSRD